MTPVSNSLIPAATSGAASADGAVDRQANLASDPLAQKETFLKLLVAQIKNQNPLDPADGIEFLSQLAQFSQLEQMLGMRAELETIRKSLQPAPGGNPTAAAGDQTQGV
jgi:flagellar basal-body rod modification protein FlgD